MSAFASYIVVLDFRGVFCAARIENTSWQGKASGSSESVGYCRQQLLGKHLRLLQAFPFVFKKPYLSWLPT